MSAYTCILCMRVYVHDCVVVVVTFVLDASTCQNNWLDMFVSDAPEGDQTNRAVHRLRPPARRPKDLQVPHAPLLDAWCALCPDQPAAPLHTVLPGRLALAAGESAGLHLRGDPCVNPFHGLRPIREVGIGKSGGGFDQSGFLFC